MEYLSDAHQEHIRNFLKFLKQKRKLSIQTIGAEFEDAKFDRLIENMYTKEEVMDLLDSIANVIKDAHGDSLNNIANMTGLLLKQLFQQAEDNGIRLDTDIGAVEDQSLLREMERLRLDKPPQTRGLRPGRKLESLGESQAKLIEFNGKLDESNKVLQEKYHNLKQECAQVVKEKSELNVIISELRDELRELKKEHKINNERNNKLRMDQNAEEEINSLRAELEEARIEMDRKLNQSKQFIQLKNLLKSKNSELRELHNQLRKYEEDDDHYK